MDAPPAKMVGQHINYPKTPPKTPQAERPLFDHMSAAGVCASPKDYAMTPAHPLYLTLVIATHRDDPEVAEPAIITGFAMLQVYRHSSDTLSFALNAAVTQTLDDEPMLLTRLADMLPMPKFIVAEAIERRIFAPLDRSNPIVAAHLRHRIARLQTALAVDLSHGATRRTAPPSRIAVTDRKVTDPDRARADLEQCAIDDWVRFVLG
jgi:hypothetical protein